MIQKIKIRFTAVAMAALFVLLALIVTGMNIINPLAAIGAAGMMLDFLGEKEAAAAIDRSIAYITGNKMKSQAAGKMGYSTSEVGDLVVENL